MAAKNTNTNTTLPSNTVIPFGVSILSDQTSLLYRSKRRGHNKLSLAIATDTVSFSEIDAPVLMHGSSSSVDIDKIDLAQLTHVLDSRVITYSQNGSMHLAQSSDDAELGIELWRVLRNTPKAEYGILVPEFKHNGNYVLYHSKNNLAVSLSKNLTSWHGPSNSLATRRAGLFDRNSIRIFAAQTVKQGILVLYQSQTKQNKRNTTSVGAALFDKTDPTKLLWRSRQPLWEVRSRKSEPTTAIGAVISNEHLVVYFRSKSGGLFIVNISSPFRDAAFKADRIQLARHSANPLIGPEGGGPWESVGTFNPAVLQDDDRIHIMYRALDHSGMSRVGYASSSDGISIDERHAEPAYWPRAAFEAGQGEPAYNSWSDEFASGGGWGGVEDPKITAIDGKVYITYVAHPGYGPPRLAMSSISQDDFRNHRWDNWEEPRLISEPGVVNKSGIILPEKIDGRYVIFHRVFPDILIHYTDDLENLGRSEWLDSHDSIATRPDGWDSRKLSIGATPIRINEGWLVIYHAVDDKDDGKYKIGAMILDINDPSKVIARTNQPILEPEMPYENEWKYGIAYPSGAAIISDSLHVYYGGGDRHVCVATAPLQSFITGLLQHKPVHLNNPRSLD